MINKQIIIMAIAVAAIASYMLPINQLFAKPDLKTAIQNEVKSKIAAATTSSQTTINDVKKDTPPATNNNNQNTPSINNNNGNHGNNNGDNNNSCQHAKGYGCVEHNPHFTG
jgi:1,2-phenylacetyl-CoA epoxidase catalytic subunit